MKEKKQNLKNPAAVALGKLGGKTTGPTKRRDVDYAALARKSHEARRRNLAQAEGTAEKET